MRVEEVQVYLTCKTTRVVVHPVTGGRNWRRGAGQKKIFETKGQLSTTNEKEAQSTDK
jgi:hypothetical protein